MSRSKAFSLSLVSLFMKTTGWGFFGEGVVVSLVLGFFLHEEIERNYSANLVPKYTVYLQHGKSHKLPTLFARAETNIDWRRYFKKIKWMFS